MKNIRWLYCILIIMLIPFSAYGAGLEEIVEGMPTYNEIEKYANEVDSLFSDELAKYNYLDDYENIKLEPGSILEQGFFRDRESAVWLYDEGRNGYISWAKDKEGKNRITEIVWQGKGNNVPYFREIALGSSLEQIWEFLSHDSNQETGLTDWRIDFRQTEQSSIIVYAKDDEGKEAWGLKIVFDQDYQAGMISLTWIVQEIEEATSIYDRG